MMVEFKGQEGKDGLGGTTQKTTPITTPETLVKTLVETLGKTRAKTQERIFEQFRNNPQLALADKDT